MRSTITAGFRQRLLADRRSGCPHESIRHHPYHCNPTIYSSLCVLHEAYLSRSTVFKCCIKSTTEARGCQVDGRKNPVYKVGILLCVIYKQKAKFPNRTKNANKMLQTVHMNKKITWFYDFFIENIKMVCYNHINVRRI